MIFDNPDEMELINLKCVLDGLQLEQDLYMLHKGKPDDDNNLIQQVKDSGLITDLKVSLGVYKRRLDEDKRIGVKFYALRKDII